MNVTVAPQVTLAAVADAAPPLQLPQLVALQDLCLAHALRGSKGLAANMGHGGSGACWLILANEHTLKNASGSAIAQQISGGGEGL